MTVSHGSHCIRFRSRHNHDIGCWRIGVRVSGTKDKYASVCDNWGPFPTYKPDISIWHKTQYLIRTNSIERRHARIELLLFASFLHSFVLRVGGRTVSRWRETFQFE